MPNQFVLSFSVRPGAISRDEETGWFNGANALKNTGRLFRAIEDKEQNWRFKLVHARRPKDWEEKDPSAQCPIASDGNAEELIFSSWEADSPVRGGDQLGGARVLLRRMFYGG